jgi:hypothetical protein
MRKRAPRRRLVLRLTLRLLRLGVVLRLSKAPLM